MCSSGFHRRFLSRFELADPEKRLLKPRLPDPARVRHEYLPVTRRIRHLNGDAQSLAVAAEKLKCFTTPSLIQGIHLRG
jgi:hypothetical protein